MLSLRRLTAFTQVDGLIARCGTAVGLGMPAFRDIAGRTAAPAKDPA